MAKSIRNTLFIDIQEGLPDALVGHLGLDKQDANDRCRALLTTDPAIEIERKRLQIEQSNIDEAKLRIQALLHEGKYKQEMAMTALADMELGGDTTMGDDTTTSGTGDHDR